MLSFVDVLTMRNNGPGDGDHVQLDYLLFRTKWCNSVKDSRAFSSFYSVDSDHKMIPDKVKISLRVSKKAAAWH